LEDQVEFSIAFRTSNAGSSIVWARNDAAARLVGWQLDAERLIVGGFEVLIEV
jgi:hypothetical protein